VWRDGKESEICTAGLEFESGRASFIRAWDSRGFTHSSEPIKYDFRKAKFPQIKKKIKRQTIVLSLSFFFCGSSH